MIIVVVIIKKNTNYCVKRDFDFMELIKNKKVNL